MTPSEPVVPVDRPPAGARRTSPLTAAFGFASLGFAVLSVLATAWIEQQAGLGGTDEGIGGLWFELALTVFGLNQIVKWWFRTYDVGTDQLVIDEGVLTRHHRVVPYGRIQQIDLHRSFLAQLFGLAELRIDTAGGEQTTVRLALLDLASAERLRAWALARRAALQAGPAAAPGASAATGAVAVGGAPGATTTAPWLAPPPPVERRLLELDAGRVALAVLTAAGPVAIVGLGLLAAVWVGAWTLADGGAPDLGAVGVLAFVLVGTAVLVVIQGVGALFTFHGYRLSVIDDDLHLRHGLFEVRQLTVPRRRVQRITVVDNPLRRALGIVSLTVHSAAATGGGEDAARRLEVLSLPRRDLPAFVAALMDDAGWVPPDVVPRTASARRRAVVRRVAIVALPLLPPAVLTFPGGLAFLLLGLLGVPWGLAAHRRAGHGVSPTLSAFASGALVHRLELVPHARVQSARSSRSFFQRRAGLATLRLDVAGSGGSPGLHDLAEASADELRRDLPRRSR
ncbi:MAG: PH domain-containing protein [Acidimicrobiales bacterium]|jgi:putative membrane protein|nr:PH domain-containing protein [Acidimicrobiales bacterium]